MLPTQTNLDGALALGEGHNGTLTVAKDLDLNVAGVLQGGRQVGSTKAGWALGPRPAESLSKRRRPWETLCGRWQCGVVQFALVCCHVK